MRVNKVVCIFLSVMVVIGLLGCKGRESSQVNDESNTKVETYQQMVPMTYDRTVLDGRMEAAVIQNGTVYGYCYDELGIRVFAQVIETGAKRNVEVPGKQVIENMTVTPEGKIVLFGMEENSFCLWEICEDGTVNRVQDIEMEKLEAMRELKGLQVDGAGNYYLWYQTIDHAGDGGYCFVDRVYAKAPDLSTIYWEQVENSDYSGVLGLYLNEEQKVMVVENGEEDFYVRELGMVKGKEEDRIGMDVPEMYRRSMLAPLFLSGTDILYVYDNALHRYQVEERADQKLLNLADGGIVESEILYLRLSGDQIEVVDNHGSNAGSEYSCFRQGEIQQSNITIAVQTMSSPLKEIIADYNRAQDQVRITPITYVEGHQYQEGQDKLRLDMVQGKAPDILFTEGIDYELFAAAGAYKNLYELMGDDRELFLPSVLSAYEIDGALYTISYGFTVWTMLAPGNVAQGRRGISLEELMKLTRERGNDVSSIYGFFEEESIISTLCSFGLDEFIDWSNKNCNFTCVEFEGVLDFAKEKTWKPYMGLCQGFRSGEYLAEIVLLSSIEEFCLQRAIVGGNAEAMGIPGVKGTGTIAELGGMVAVNAATEYPREAWDFLKYYILNAGQYDDRLLPITTEQFEQMLEKSMEVKYLDKDSREKQVKKSYYEDGNPAIEIYKAEKRDVEDFRELVEGISGRFIYNNTIRNIVEEEAEAYFKNQKTAKQVSEIIQNRVLLYLNE